MKIVDKILLPVLVVGLISHCMSLLIALMEHEGTRVGFFWDSRSTLLSIFTLLICTLVIASIRKQDVEVKRGATKVAPKQVTLADVLLRYWPELTNTMTNCSHEPEGLLFTYHIPKGMRHLIPEMRDKVLAEATTEFHWVIVADLEAFMEKRGLA